MDMERRDDGERDERCGHRKLVFKSWVEKEKLMSNKLRKTRTAVSSTEE